MSKSKYLECAKIINTHGVRGEIKLESMCDTPQILASLGRVFFREGDTFKERKVLHASVFKSFVIASVEGVNDIDAAAALKGRIIYAAREDFELPEGSFFIADIIGLDVIDNVTGRVYGKVTDVINRGASDIYVVNTPSGERMVPVVDEFVKKVDVEVGVFVETIPGLLED